MNASEPLLDLSILDRLRELGGKVARPDEDVVAELVRLFDRDTRLQINELRAQREPATTDKSAPEKTEDNTSLKRTAEIAHAMKGACLAVGARRVANLAHKLESESRAGDGDKRDESVDRIAFHLEQTWNALEEVVAQQ